jgi:hypothetical protein
MSSPLRIATWFTVVLVKLGANMSLRLVHLREAIKEMLPDFHSEAVRRSGR